MIPSIRQYGMIVFWLWMTSSLTFADGIRNELDSFLQSHCIDCHDGSEAEAGLDLSRIGSNLADEATFARWERIHDRVANHEMPPAEHDQPSADHGNEFVNSLAGSLTKAHTSHKGTVLRRLNRQEYENTVNDLFGTNLRLAEMLPEDGRSNEFDNVGESLSVSMVHLQSYLDAADQVLNSTIQQTLQKPNRTVVRASYAESRGAEKFLGNQWLLLDDGAVVFFRRLGYPTGMLREANAQQRGLYRIRVTGYAHQSNRPITFSIGATTYERGATNPTYGYFSLPPGPPTTIETTVWIESRYMITITPYGISDPDNAIKRDGIENYKGPGLAIQSVEVDGPIVDEFPKRGHHLIFDGLNRSEIIPRNPADKKTPWYQPKFEINEDRLDANVRASLKRVATRCFRRNVSESEIQGYADLFAAERKSGHSIEDSLRTAVSAILCSTDFLFLQEPSGWLDDNAIATRLSYFLHRTAPDEKLMAAASEGKLSKDPATLASHTQRLLDDPRCERFIRDFTDAWLDLRDIDFTAPDQDLFPEFDAYLQFSMVEETRQFVHQLIQKNLPIRNLVKSDFAMLNERLTEHYAMDRVIGPEIRSVQLGPDSVRGGLLSQASILKVSANGTNTSPVVRGVWVNERILGNSPPPPPPGIPGVEPDIRGAATLRELLDKHRNSDTCRSCHQMIDPPGFALECFNPIGGYRDRFRSMNSGEKVSLVVDGRKVRYSLGLPVDSSGQTSDGKTFSGFNEFRDQLAAREDILAKTLATKLLTFATGREMGFSDRVTIDAMVAASAKRGHGVRDLIHQVVLSTIFRQK